LRLRERDRYTIYEKIENIVSFAGINGQR
jgi:hypothetical protein